MRHVNLNGEIRKQETENNQSLYTVLDESEVIHMGFGVQWNWSSVA